jgi:hypothetical protein
MAYRYRQLGEGWECNFSKESARLGVQGDFWVE